MQPGADGGIHFGDEVRRDVDQLRLGAGCGGDAFVDLVPRHHFIGGDVKGLAHGVGPAQQAEQALGKVTGVGHHPQGSPVSVKRQGQPLAHAMHRGEVDAESRGNPGIAVGERRSHDGHRESVALVRLRQEAFGGDLFLRVLPERVFQWRLFGDDVVARRFLVDRGRADEDVLFDLAGEHLHIGGRLRGVEHDPVDHHVEGLGSQRLRHGATIVDVAVDGAHARGQLDPTLAPVEMHHIDVALSGQA